MKRKNCYITSTLTTHKDKKSEIIGPCGPCSFINLVGLIGNFELEKELAETGRMKHFYASDFTSYLRGGEKYNKKLVIYTDNTSVSKSTLNMMCKYENILKEKQKEMKEQCQKRHTQILKKNHDKINILTKSPLETINDLLESNHSVAFNVYVKADDNAGEESLHIGHLRNCYKKENGKYFINDSCYGPLKLSAEEMKKSLDKVKENGQYYDIIGYKK